MLKKSMSYGSGFMSTSDPSFRKWKHSQHYSKRRKRLDKTSSAYMTMCLGPVVKKRKKIFGIF